MTSDSVHYLVPSMKPLTAQLISFSTLARFRRRGEGSWVGGSKVRRVSIASDRVDGRLLIVAEMTSAKTYFLFPLHNPAPYSSSYSLYSLSMERLLPVP